MNRQLASGKMQQTNNVCTRIVLRCWSVGLLLSCLAVAWAPGAVHGQEVDLPSGFQRIAGQYVDIVTDIPLTDALRELPAVFDAAIPHWCKAFNVDIRDVRGWHGDVYLMRAKERFLQAGLLPSNLDGFPYGYQWKNRMWIHEQATEYYFRHLLLHEGTHWFMWKQFGRNGPPWLMEGMAEWYGTHRWDGETLEMGIIPATKQEVPGWGRITIIQEQLADGVAPSLETILRYGKTAHRHADAYAWSWAVVLFLRHHPDTQVAFEELLKQPMRDDETQTRALFRKLRNAWPRVRAEWNATLTDLEYGFDPTRQFTKLTARPKLLTASKRIDVAADQSWQASGVKVPRGVSISIRATGEFTVANTSSPWVSQPAGVTLEYHLGRPLGELQMAVLGPIPAEPGEAGLVEPIPVGSGGTFQVATGGELFFRVNETSAGLSDNSGTIQVEISR